jgi:hypothetical protein
MTVGTDANSSQGVLYAMYSLTKKLNAISKKYYIEILVTTKFSAQQVPVLPEL